jgi:hypothetical protein
MLKQGPRGISEAVRAVQEALESRRRTSAEVLALERESSFAGAGSSHALRGVEAKGCGRRDQYMAEIPGCSRPVQGGCASRC